MVSPSESSEEIHVLTAWRNLDQVRKPEAFPGWLKRVMVTQCSRLTRGKRLETVALDSFEDKVKQDRYIVIAILYGSLSHDTVWRKSDIDIMLIGREEKPGKSTSVSLYLDSRTFSPGSAIAGVHRIATRGRVGCANAFRTDGPLST